MEISETLTQQIIAVFLVSLRIVPVFVFAQPFTLIKVPPSVRLLLALGLAVWLVNVSRPDRTFDSNEIILAMMGELVIGASTALALQWAFASLLIAGRSVDIQAGFGLALLIDPATRAQMPLVGTLFVYAAAIVFFAVDGPAELLVIWANSLKALPIGEGIGGVNIPALLVYLSGALFIAVGVAGITLLSLFLIDVTVAFLSRTLPQMNALLIGFQIKTLAVLMTLPLAIAYSSAIFLRLVRMSLDTAPQLLIGP